MLFSQPPECRSRFADFVQNFFFTHKVVVHILLHTFLLHQVVSRDRSRRVDTQFQFVPAVGSPARRFTLARA